MINSLKEKYTANKKRGFTLIELIVVMAIIAVLVLLAAPKFIGHAEKAQVRNIQNDVKVAEMKVSEALIDGSDMWDYDVPSNTLKDLISEDGTETTLYGKGGPIYDKSKVENETYHVLPRTFIEKDIRSRLEGTFYANKNGTVYYEKGIAHTGDVDEEGPGYSEEEVQDLIDIEYIPVATAEDLNSIRSTKKRIYAAGTKWEGTYTGGLDKQYIQVADINLSKFTNFEPIGTDGSEFTGTFDGGSYVISNLKIDRGTEDYVGLFGQATGATFKNVGLEDVNVTGGKFIGGLVGHQRNAATTNSYATGSVNGASNSVGGLVGHQYGSSTVTNSYATGSVTGEDFVGGLVGAQSVSSTVTNSYATGSVTGRDDTGGLVGFLSNSSTVTNSYATGSVTGTGTGTGGLAGRKSGSSTVITDSYYDKETTGQTASAGGTGKTTAEMKNKDTYVDWDFESIWTIENNQYPTLR